MRITVGYGDPARGQVRKLLLFCQTYLIGWWAGLTSPDFRKNGLLSNLFTKSGLHLTKMTGMEVWFTFQRMFTMGGFTKCEDLL